VGRQTSAQCGYATLRAARACGGRAQRLHLCPTPRGTRCCFGDISMPGIRGLWAGDARDSDRQARSLWHPGTRRRRDWFATDSAVVAWAGGRLHGPDDAQVERREVDLGRRAIASARHLATGSPRMHSRGVARPDDCIGHWRSPAPTGVRGGRSSLRSGRSERCRERVRRVRGARSIHNANFLNVDRRQGRAVRLRQPSNQAEDEE
jgi:hypothetical protein